MKKYIEQRIPVEVKGEYDIIVAGSGPAGIGAAVADLLYAAVDPRIKYD